MTATPSPVALSVWELRWSNRYKPRPPGFLEIFMRIATPIAKGQGAGRCPQEMQEAWEEIHHYGYCVVWYLDGPPARVLPLASKQRIRRRNLWKRLLSRFPMFLEDFYRSTIVAKPDYYGAYLAGEFADVAFARTTMGKLRIIKATDGHAASE